MRLEESQEGVESQTASEEGVPTCQESFRNSHLSKQCSGEHLSCYYEREGPNEPRLKLIQPEERYFYLLYIYGSQVSFHQNRIFLQLNKKFED